MGKWTSQGFVANTLAYYKDLIQKIFIEAYGDSFDTSDTLPQGVIIQRIAELMYNMDMDGINVFSLINPNTATGMWLDIIGSIRGITRIPGIPQMINTEVTSDSSALPYAIPAGTSFVVGASSFIVKENTTITKEKTTVVCEYDGDGDSNASVGDLMTSTLKEIKDIKITGLVSGQKIESDSDYRLRILSFKNVSASTVEHVSQLIKNSPLVKTSGFNYNDTSEETTIAPHSTEWLVAPKDGVDLELFKQTIAKIIVDNKSPESETDGNTAVTVNDAFGASKVVNFTIPEKIELQIYVQTSTPEETGVLDFSSVPEERANIANYINGLKIGSDISMSKILNFISGDSGYDIVKYQIKALTDEEWVTNGNYTINDKEYPYINVTNKL